MFDQSLFDNSLLSRKDFEKIENTELPLVERHYLKILAHCLACFKNMKKEMVSGSFPDESIRFQWCFNQPSLKNEPDFINVLLKQFSVAATQLETFAGNCGLTPLELTVDDLIKEISKSK